MDIGKDKLLHKWLDVIEAAQDKGLTPEQVMKYVSGWKAKTPAELDRKIFIGLSTYIRGPNYKNPTDSIIRFIKSADFKLYPTLIPNILYEFKPPLFRHS